MKKFTSIVLTLSIIIFLQPTLSLARAASEEKSLTGHTGFGYTSQIATTSLGTIPALSMKTYFSKSLAASLGVGFDTRSANSTLGIGLKIFQNVFYESNLIFYVGCGGAYVNQNGSNFQGSLFLGSEFFFSQLPSLGFSFEGGVRGDNTTGSFAIRTTGDSFLTAGVHFYL